MHTSAGRSLSRRLSLIGTVTALAILSSTNTQHSTPMTGTTMVVAAMDLRGEPARSSTGAITAAGVPPVTSSFYVNASYIDVCGLNATTGCPLYNAAATETVPPNGGLTILDFGAPCYEPATLEWGTQLFHSQSCTPDITLAVLAQAWVRGYQTNPNRTASPNYALAAGTSNSLTAAIPGNALTADQMAQHGQAWFTGVVSPVAAVARTLPTQVTIWAANDIEESSDDNWYDGATTIAWVDAYAAASGASKPCDVSRDALMADYGDYVPNEPGWSVGAVHHVAWGSPPACPVPEIYGNVNAAEWQSLNLDAQNAGLPRMLFTAVLSEDGAGGSLGAQDSWNALRNASGQAAPYLTVIGATGPLAPEVPGPPTSVTAAPGPGLATVSWRAPAWDGGTRITAYTITAYRGSVIAQVVTLTGWPSTETAVIAGLVNGASYTFYVRAANQVGDGSVSLPSNSAAPSALFPVR